MNILYKFPIDVHWRRLKFNIKVNGDISNGNETKDSVFVNHAMLPFWPLTLDVTLTLKIKLVYFSKQLEIQGSNLALAHSQIASGFSCFASRNFKHSQNICE